MARRFPQGIDGPTVRRLRKQARWSQQRLVQEIRAAAVDLGEHQPAVTVQMISRWENGQGGISAGYARLIEHAFSRTVDTDDHEDDALAEVNRRAFLLGTTAAVSLAVVNRLGNEPWQRLTAAVGSRTPIDVSTVDGAQALTDQLAQMFQPVSPRLLVGPVRSHLDNLTGLLTDGALTTGLRARLTSIAAETTILLGWLSKETGDYATAQQCFTSALTAAVEAGDHDIGAYAIASAATLPAFRSSPEQSLALVTSTELRGANLRKSSTATRIWLSVLTAEIHTRTNNDADAFHALDHAADLLDQLDPEEARRPVLGHFDRASLLGERGITAVRLGRATDAGPDLESALSELASYPKTQSRILTAMARMYLRQHQIENAASTAVRSLTVAQQSGSGVGVDDVRSLRHDLQPWADSSPVRELDELLAVHL